MIGRLRSFGTSAILIDRVRTGGHREARDGIAVLALIRLRHPIAMKGEIGKNKA